MKIIRTGRHTLAHGDLRAGDGLRLLEAAGRPAVIYTDPPWNSGVERAFRTRAGAPPAQEPTGAPGFAGFLDALCETCAAAGVPAFLEFSATSGPIREAIARSGGQVVAEWGTTYSSGRGRVASLLLLASWSGISPAVGDLCGIDSRVLPEAALRALEDAGWQPGTVMDLCVGSGCTLRAAIRRRWRCVGMDIAMKRVEQCSQVASRADP